MWQPPSGREPKAPKGTGAAQREAWELSSAGCARVQPGVALAAQMSSLPAPSTLDTGLALLKVTLHTQGSLNSLKGADKNLLKEECHSQESKPLCCGPGALSYLAVTHPRAGLSPAWHSGPQGGSQWHSPGISHSSSSTAEWLLLRKPFTEPQN